MCQYNWSNLASSVRKLNVLQDLSPIIEHLNDFIVSFVYKQTIQFTEYLFIYIFNKNLYLYLYLLE